MIQDYERRRNLKRVICNGCAVGLRTREGKTSLRKAWCVATKNKHLLQHLDLRCQKNHAKGKRERGETARASRYTTPFARTVTDSLSTCEVWSRILEELREQPEVAAAASEQPERALAPLDIDPEERRDIETKIQKIHCSTGHSNMQNLFRALELRSAHPKVIQVAQQWKCSICQHRRKQDPRRFATLETIPWNWGRLQVDMATWMHPRTKENIMFWW